VGDLRREQPHFAPVEELNRYHDALNAFLDKVEGRRVGADEPDESLETC
jgi:hypothetical protein